MFGAFLIAEEIEQVGDKPDNSDAAPKNSKGYQGVLAQHEDSVGRLEQIHDELSFTRKQLEALLTRIEELKRLHEQEHVRELGLRQKIAEVERSKAQEIDLEKVEERAKALTQQATSLQKEEESKGEK